MYKEVPGLVMFSELGEDSIIVALSDIIREFDSGEYDKKELVYRINKEIHKLLEVGTDYGFDKNLWHDYIAYVIVTNENPFSLTTERMQEIEGSANRFVLEDMRIFNHLFEYDFSRLEKSLGISCFSTITDYKSIHKRSQLFNRSVSEKVRKLSDDIESGLERAGYAGSDKELSVEVDDAAAEETMKTVVGFYRSYGVGMFGLNTAFRLVEGSDPVSFAPINNTDSVKLDDLVGYEVQKQKLRENTESFLDGKPANNVLLFGDAGTGKSTSIKALINEYQDRGLRMIELYKHQMGSLSAIISSVKYRNYRFIIYMDDLSFEENETEYKYLKAVIEGGLENRPDNVLIYATSNRRNLIRESWNDIKDIELDKHRSDTIQEKLSLVSRFGVTIPYMRPNKKEYEEIVKGIAGRKEGLELTEQELLEVANKWSVSHGGMSGRAAQQLIDSLN
ncbi:MAG: ATP-binding protein [Eubacterium sp.]|nr:ATP-binding protein [Eubacterium sp.]